MKIGPCRKEMFSDLLFCPFLTVAAGLACAKWHWNFYVTASLVVLMLVVFGNAVMSYLYLGREIILSTDSCTFSFWGYQHICDWKNVKVLLCTPDKKSISNDILGPGIVIYDAALEIPSKKLTPSFCRTHHPIKSVFIRFRSKADEKRNTWEAPRSATYGYVVEKEEILGYLKSIGVL